MNHFLDIGANAGNTFDWYLLKTNEYDGWHIWCFEPSARHLEALRIRCSEVIANNEHKYSITICPFALSDFTGSSPIFETTDGLGDSLLEESGGKPIDLMCAVIDAATFISQAIPEPDRVVLKIDVEGSEIRILNSILGFQSIVPRIDKMLLEFHAITLSQQDEICGRVRAHGIPIEWWTL